MGTSPASPTASACNPSATSLQGAEVTYNGSCGELTGGTAEMYARESFARGPMFTDTVTFPGPRGTATAWNTINCTPGE